MDNAVFGNGYNIAFNVGISSPHANDFAAERDKTFLIFAFHSYDAVIPVNHADFNVGIVYRGKALFYTRFMHRHKVFAALEVFVGKD